MENQESPQPEEPFLTLKMGPEEKNVRVECPQIGVSTTASTKAFAKNLIASMAESRAEAILSKMEEGTLTEDITKDIILTAQKIVEAKKQGRKVQDLFK